MFDPATRTLTVGGRSFVASPLSAEQVRAFHDAPDEQAGLLVLLRQAFPAKLSMLWTGDPVTLLLREPVAEVERTMAAFFLWAAVRLHRP